MRQCSYSEEQIEQFRSIQVDDNVGPDQRRLLTSNPDGVRMRKVLMMIVVLVKIVRRREVERGSQLQQQ